jgi:hypothetical protein
MTTQKRYDPSRHGPFYGFMQESAGNIFFVHGTSGLDTNDGTTPETAFLTITAALAACTAGNNDYIFVVSYPGDAGEAVWPIPIDISKVHIIGTPTQASPSPLINAPADTACFTIYASGGNTEIAGLEMTAGATAACIDTSGVVWKANIHHNDFGWQAGARDGILLPGVADCPHWLIHHNRFGVGLTRSGIRMEHNSTRSVISNNLFTVLLGAIGIHLQGLCTGGINILDNKFRTPDNAAGEAITTSATAIGLATGNEAAEGKGAIGNNPYVDGGSFSWGINWANIVATLPA